MINKIIDWFNGSSVKSLTDKSSSVLNVFQKTVLELEIVNSKVTEEIDNRELIIKHLELEKVELEKLKISNDKVVTKITEFLK